MKGKKLLLMKIKVLQIILPGIQLPNCFKLTINLKNGNDVTIFRHKVILKFFEGFLFLLPILVAGPSFVSILSLVMEL